MLITVLTDLDRRRGAPITWRLSTRDAAAFVAAYRDGRLWSMPWVRSCVSPAIRGTIGEYAQAGNVVLDLRTGFGADTYFLALPRDHSRTRSGFDPDDICWRPLGVDQALSEAFWTAFEAAEEILL
jgi:hypothetical protein